ncbi:Hypothetical predicted protein [Pelobates cultripes]|uniref:Uncharacterized protein n=1 Tax=Pelobates cultripes TaxID=61616 RepID=A0AAD1RA76_PELCU|nr:Hypothetical predicted protein [Pelobates cultripes]
MFAKADKTTMVTKLRLLIREEIMEVFTQILGEEAHEEYHIERSHRALRPPRRDGLPRNIIFCLLSFRLKEAIMQAARPQAITFKDATVSLYQDLSTLTLEAHQALRTLTCLLQERRIPYKWGFPFNLQAKDNVWRTLRWPNEVSGLLRALNLPAVSVPNAILDSHRHNLTYRTKPTSHS